MRISLMAAFKTYTRNGVTAEMTHSSFWSGVLRGDRMATINGFGRSEWDALASMSLQAFNEANRPSKPTDKPAKRKAPAPLPKLPKVKPAPMLDEEDGSPDPDDDDDDDEDDDKELLAEAKHARVAAAAAGVRLSSRHSVARAILNERAAAPSARDVIKKAVHDAKVSGMSARGLSKLRSELTKGTIR
jgi:hypothetical protein